VDANNTGKNALKVATALSKRIGATLQIFISDAFDEPLKVLLDSALKELDELQTYAQEYIENESIQAAIKQVIGEKFQKILELYQQEVIDEKTLIGKLTNEIRESGVQIMVMGVPLFTSTGISEFEKNFIQESLGRYALMLLRDRTIPANFLIVPGKMGEIKDKVLAFVDIEQQPTSIVALYRRTLSFATEETEFKIVGIIENKVIETVARLEIPDEDPEATPEIKAVTTRLQSKMEDTLASITLKKEIDDVIIKGSPTYDVRTGTIPEIVREFLDAFNPGIVFVRSVPGLEENLDPFAEIVTRQVLSAGVPILVLWD
jgi:hypothetical protein